ncbi:hypothetical protein Patl1_17449 [Pistacia atlantica]|uniref:Uncharacterized protein n=1 Tax=Pistacia atlantica TaxID=434234 RepID=A0ACC1C194_9ROSI|nr:hypothetical protein Patl1_17449 [Pistacia atlantica]
MSFKIKLFSTYVKSKKLISHTIIRIFNTSCYEFKIDFEYQNLNLMK